MRISKELLHNTLTLQDFAYIDVTNGGIYNRTSAEYALNDQLHAMLGYDYFHADKGMFNIYKKNTEIWLKLKYSFLALIPTSLSYHNLLYHSQTIVAEYGLTMVELCFDYA